MQIAYTHRSKKTCTLPKTCPAATRVLLIGSALFCLPAAICLSEDTINSVIQTEILQWEQLRKLTPSGRRHLLLFEQMYRPDTSTMAVITVRAQRCGDTVPNVMRELGISPVGDAVSKETRNALWHTELESINKLVAKDTDFLDTAHINSFLDDVDFRASQLTVTIDSITDDSDEEKNRRVDAVHRIGGMIRFLDKIASAFEESGQWDNRLKVNLRILDLELIRHTFLEQINTRQTKNLVRINDIAAHENCNTAFSVAKRRAVGNMENTRQLELRRSEYYYIIGRYRSRNQEGCGR